MSANDNKKIRAPKLAMTAPMVAAGKEVLTAMVAALGDVATFLPEYISERI